MKTLLSILLVLCVITPFKSIAKSKKIPNCLKSIVLFSKPSADKDKKKAVTGTGFIVAYKEKLCVATNLDIIFTTIKPNISTIDGNELKYSKILIPKDKRNVVLFELDPETPKCIYKCLELDLDVSEDTDIDDKVLTFGCKSNWETVTKSKGTISALGPVNIEIESKVSYNMNGGPVISYNTGTVVGVLSKLSISLGEESNSKVCKVIRIDSIKELNPLDEDKFTEDKKRLKEKEIVLKNIYEMYTDILAEIGKLQELIDSGKGTQKSHIQKVIDKNKAVIGKIKTIIEEMKSEGPYSMKYFQTRHNHVISSALMNIKKFQELEKVFDKLDKANKKSMEKSKLKGIDLKLDI